MKTNEYPFTVHDIDLFFHELKISLSPANIDESYKPGLNRVTINNCSVFLPDDLDCKDLPWLWHEVYDSFENNPSSYNHPKIDYESLEWVLDAGAAEGYFSLFCAEKVPAKTRIYAIEPLQIMHNPLKETMRYNRITNVEVINAAVGENDEIAYIEQDPIHPCDSHLSKYDGQDKSIANKDLQQVQCSRLDTFALTLGLTGRGLVKMDIEGYEMSALNGAVELLSNQKPFLAIAVYHEYSNAIKCAQIVKSANPEYTIEFRGCYGYFSPPRPYMIFAY
ncbi:MAG: FkbM family methyltransferase [Cyanobacteriota bacterium]